MEMNDENKNKNPHVIFETTEGIIEAEIFLDKVPLTANNFLKLVNKGFYDNLIVHRVIPKFMIQTGDPKGDGTGGPGYTIKDEFDSNLIHKRGVLSMANAGPNTGGSQFFITVIDTPWLDGAHAVFGKVLRGLDVVDLISEAERDLNDKPLQKITLAKVYQKNI